MKELICIICPRGCHLTVDENLNVTGNFCPRGAKYAVSELTHPERTLTTTVKIDSLIEDRLPVKTLTPLPKDKMMEAMQEINKISVKAPILIGDVIIEDLCNTGVKLVATKNIAE